MRNSMDDNQALTDADYQALASFRYALRQFTTFSESKATEAGLTPRQHQALLAIRAAHEPATVGFVAERLIMKPHSATGLIDRLEASGLVSRHSSAKDRGLSGLSIGMGGGRERGG